MTWRKTEATSRELSEIATDQDIVAELQRLADQPRYPPGLREHVLNVLNENVIKQQSVRAKAAASHRSASSTGLNRKRMIRCRTIPESLTFGQAPALLVNFID